jgi:hypothetical protein
MNYTGGIYPPAPPRLSSPCFCYLDFLCRIGADGRSPTVMEALGKHVRTSTAITLDALSVSRIACAGVILDAGGKMKVFEGAGSEGTRFILGKVVGFVARDGLPV